jgi:hypothetical protein
MRTHLTFSNVVAGLALFVALGGTSYAVARLPASSVGSRQVKDHSLRTRDLHRGAVKSATVADRSLRAADFGAGQLPAGPRGPKGDPGSDAQFNGAAAGGDLSGTYPAPQLKPGSIDSPSLFAAGAVPAAVVRHTTSTALAAGEHLIDWDTVDADRGGLFDAANNLFTAPVAGLYAVEASLFIQNVNPGGVADLRIGSDTPQLTYAAAQAPADGNGFVSLSASGVVSMTAGQRIFTSVGVPDAATLSANPAQFSIHYLTP